MLKWLMRGLFALAGLIIVWCVRQLAKLALAAALYTARHPRSAVALSSAGAAVYYLGWETCLVIVGVLYLCASTWKVGHRESFDRFIGDWTRTWWRKWWIYRRRWARTFTRCELSVEENGDRHVPRLLEVTTTPYWDRLTLRMQVGQELATFRESSEKLRHAFGAERIAVREIRPAAVGIDLMHRDPLRYETIPAAAIPATTAEIDWTALPIGLTETMEPFTVSVVGGHTSVAGATGSGKAGAEWNIMRRLAPAIADGTVRCIFIDPKARELRQGRGVLCAVEDYAVTEDETLALLQRCREQMEAANEKSGAAGERNFVPSQDRPLNIIFIDELAPLLAYWKRSVRDKIEDALGLLLTQGRAAGWIIVGEIQEPTKDVFTIRDLFGRRLALRVPTESHTDAALAESAVERGAMCHQIPEDMPGVLFAVSSGSTSAVRARLGYVRDDDIAELVDFVLASRNVVSLDKHRAGAAGITAA